MILEKPSSWDDGSVYRGSSFTLEGQVLDGDYSRGRMMNSGRNYAYGETRDYGRYARHSKEDKIAQLEHMMENASSEVERRAFMDAIRSIEKQ